ncbi:MAG: DUF2059 domain-containing protein [Candidatus Acidiferrales bacterium]
MKMRILLGICLLAAGPALGQNPPAPAEQGSAATTQKVDPEKEKEIRRLLQLMDVRGILEQSMASMEQQMKDAAPANQSDAEKQFSQLFLEKFRGKVKPEEFINMMIPVYDKYFSVEEVRGLNAFYETPLGQQVVKKLPKAVSEAQSAGFEYGRQAGEAAVQEVLQEHPELKQALDQNSKPPN